MYVEKDFWTRILYLISKYFRILDLKHSIGSVIEVLRSVEEYTSFFKVKIDTGREIDGITLLEFHKSIHYKNTNLVS